MTTTSSSANAITMHVEIAASPEAVFAALTVPALLDAWWGTADRPVRWEVDLRIGGSWKAVGWDESCGDWVVSGEILELDPPWTLAVSWAERSDAKQVDGTFVRYSLEQIPGGTLVRLSHSGFGAALKARDEYQGGWPGLTARLKLHLERQRV